MERGGGGSCPHAELRREAKKGARKGLGAPVLLAFSASTCQASTTEDEDAVCSWRAAFTGNLAAKLRSGSSPEALAQRWGWLQSLSPPVQPLEPYRLRFILLHSY